MIFCTGNGNRTSYDDLACFSLSFFTISGLCNLTDFYFLFILGCVNLSFAYVEGESLLMALKDVALSSGSACTSASLEPSYVLRAIGTEEDLAHSSIRFGISRFTTEQEVDYTAEKCITEVRRLREMSPLWEMYEDGIDIKSIQWSQH